MSKVSYNYRHRRWRQSFPQKSTIVYPSNIIVAITLCLVVVDAIELLPNCGFPGKPYRAKISPQQKMIYAEGETVSYQCADYWAPPMERKCVNGQWVGPMARCGDFVKELVMRDAQCFDMSYGRPREIFHYTNMNISNTNWKHPNAFTSNRFKAGRLRIVDDHVYMWKFNFSRPVTKLFVKLNFNFINFTSLPAETQAAHRFEIEVEISPYRTCVLDYQSNNLWRENGNRIDSYFVCEAPSYSNIVADAASPPNYMVLRTRSSHNITHEFIALFFGRVYGNDTEPICGEPETDYGQSFRANVEQRDYIIDCASKDDWINSVVQLAGQTNRFSYSRKCIGDMRWNGTAPRCVPLRTCSLDGVFRSVIADHPDRMHIGGAGTGSGSGSAPANIISAVAGGGGGAGAGYGSNHANLPWLTTSTVSTPIGAAKDGAAPGDAAPIHPNSNLQIESIINYYYFIDNRTIYATEGTELTYSCGSGDYILVGKETRKCKDDRTWTGSEPTCKYLKSANELIESSNTLLIVISVMGVLLIIIIAVSCSLFYMFTKRLQRKQAKLRAEKANVDNHQHHHNNMHNSHLPGDTWNRHAAHHHPDLNFYDNIELNDTNRKTGGPDDFYEVYERIDEFARPPGAGNDYMPYNDHGYTYAVMQDAQAYSNLYSANMSSPVSAAGGATIGTMEPDYVRMLRESRAYQHIAPPRITLTDGGQLKNRDDGVDVRRSPMPINVMRKNSKRRHEEPSYLEISK